MASASQQLDSSIQTALIIAVPEVETLVGGFRAQHDPTSAEGVPAHVTVLYPFLAPARISAGAVQSLRDLFTGFPRFRTQFSEIRRFPGVLYLSPSPDTPFLRLTESVASQFSELPPYGGQFSDIVPHLTVAHADDPKRLDDIAVQLAKAAKGRLPIHATVREVALIEKRGSKWRTQLHFPLGAAALPG
jgi:2'-5' RNA ligase